ncbi:MAG: cytochrome c oxidase subunit 2 [Thermoanaerobaculia bacterium]|nr:cytochrome c oxidase subunit 2 [Thermoanaerobaculia bacterium]
MTPNTPIFPQGASTYSTEVDILFYVYLGLAAFFTVAIFGLVTVFAVKYRRKKATDVGVEPQGHATVIEVTWTVLPLILMLGAAIWGLKIYVQQLTPPPNAKEYYVVGKQWMWKIEHPDGRREINELHVPKGEDIKLKMTSEDVIHSFFIPAFRIKVDAVPGRYNTMWFNAAKTGTYHLFCAEYCGVDHARMIGRVVVMEPHEYQEWLSGTKVRAATATGEELFVAKACNTCHRPDSSARAPILNGIFGKEVALLGGKTIVADDEYIRESILNPGAKVVSGYQPIMPTFKGQLSEEEIIQLIKYVRSLSPGADKGVPKTASLAFSSSAEAHP